MSILMPVLIGCAMAYVPNILTTELAHLPLLKQPASPVYRFRRGISILGALAIIVLLVVLPVQIVIPQLA